MRGSWDLGQYRKYKRSFLFIFECLKDDKSVSGSGSKGTRQVREIK